MFVQLCKDETPMARRAAAQVGFGGSWRGRGPSRRRAVKEGQVLCEQQYACLVQSGSTALLWPPVGCTRVARPAASTLFRCLPQNLGKLAEVMEAEHVSTQLLPLFTELTQDGGWLAVRQRLLLLLLTAGSWEPSERVPAWWGIGWALGPAWPRPRL